MTSTLGKTDGEFDVIIIGSGLAGSALAAILSRHGADVLVVDSGVHPRFAMGESTTSNTLIAYQALASRYDVPELETATSLDHSLAEIGPVFGVEEHLGFIMHQDGLEPNPHETLQVGNDRSHRRTGHLFRQDADAYLFHVAVGYGATVRQAWPVAVVEVSDHRVEVLSTGGERLTGRYLVDTSGPASPVARQFRLRESPTTLKHHSRALYTHMIDVRATDDCLWMSKDDLPPVPWVAGTTHHLFERGYLWLTPFNNHARSTNPLVSVGLTFDERRYPRLSDVPPGEEFRHHVSRFPLLERIFADARTVRPWVSTDRMQYNSTATVGDRWCLLGPAAGFVDPLFARDLTNTAEVLNVLAWRLLDALRDGDFSAQRFAAVDRLQQGLIHYHDELVNSAYVSWSHFDLWNAVARVWASAWYPDNLRVNKRLTEYARTGDDRVFQRAEDDRYPGLSVRGSGAYHALFSEMVSLCGEVEQGGQHPAHAGAELMAAIESSSAVVRGLDIEDPAEHFMHPTPDRLIAAARWLATEAPEDLRDLAAASPFTPFLTARP